MMVAGTVAITGVGIPLTEIGFAGFLSKDAIIESTFAAHSGTGEYAFWLLVIAAAFTAFYSWRLIFMTFYGTPHDRKHYDHAHESPNVMMIPLYVLAAGAVLSGVLWYGDFFGHGEEAFWAGSIFAGAENHVIHAAHEVPAWVKVSPFVAMILGFGLAWSMYIYAPDSPRRLAEAQPALYQFLLNKWYFDEIYDFIFVRPAKAIGRFLWKRGDGATIDGIINGIAMGIVPRLTRLAGRAQSGYVFHYAFAMLLGVSALITWFAVTGGTQ
jgi:NADH-quinone oxidoreductase subunit L